VFNFRFTKSYSSIGPMETEIICDEHILMYAIHTKFHLNPFTSFGNESYKPSDVTSLLDRHINFVLLH
jgi:hypothetical protein